MFHIPLSKMYACMQACDVHLLTMMSTSPSPRTTLLRLWLVLLSLLLDQLLWVQQCKWWRIYIYRKLISKPSKSVSVGLA